MGLVGAYACESVAPRQRQRILSRTENLTRTSKRYLTLIRADAADVDEYDRPKTRADCKDMPRPCPFVSCRHHLYLDVNAKSGSIKYNFPNADPDAPGGPDLALMPDTCSLDVADRGEHTHEQLARFINVTTRERLRQIESAALEECEHKGGPTLSEMGEGLLVSEAAHPSHWEDAGLEPDTRTRSDVAHSDGANMGTCSVCGNDIVLRHGTIRDHAEPFTVAGAVRRVCKGTGLPPVDGSRKSVSINSPDPCGGGFFHSQRYRRGA